MKGKIIGAIAIIIFFIACSKDKFQTKPSIKLKSISSKIIPADGDMSIQLEYTDKEGDVNNDTLQLIKVRNNQWQTATIRDTLIFILPDFPSKSKGIIELQLDNQGQLISAIAPTGPGGIIQSDSLTMKFILKDNSSHVSDTLLVKDIVIQRQ